MKYMLLICGDGSTPATPEASDVGPWLEEMGRRGVRLHGSRLRPAGEAATVRVRHGELSVTDGAFAETKEQIGGYDVIECADLEEAVEVASKHPVAKFGRIEVRPFWED